MPKSSCAKPEKKRTPKPPVNELLQLLSVARGLYEACGFDMAGPIEHLGIPELPPWAKNICVQLRATIFKRFVELYPHDRAGEWRNLGKILGVGFRQLGFLQHDLLRESDVSGRKDFLQALPGWDELLGEVLKGSHTDALLAHFGDSLQSALHIGLGLASVEQHEFFSGIAEGQLLLLDTQGQLVGDRGRTTAYFELLSRWMEVEAMRQARPAKTCADLYRLVGPSLGDPRCERLEVFAEICKDVGLRMTQRGRPRKH